MAYALFCVILFTPFARGQGVFSQTDSKESFSKVSSSSEPPSKNTHTPFLKGKLSLPSPTLLAITRENQETDKNKENREDSLKGQGPRFEDLNPSVKTQQKNLPKDLKNFPLKITLPLHSRNPSNKTPSFQRFSPKDLNKGEKPTNLKTLLDAREKTLQELREKNKQVLPQDPQDILKKIPYKYSFSPSSQKD